MRDRGGVGLCQSCNEAWRTTDVNGRERIVCRALYTRPTEILIPVVKCSDYEQVGKMQRHEAAQLGWVLEIRRGKVVGFKPPSKFDPDLD